jgi:signal transduction histidine kinase
MRTRIQYFFTPPQFADEDKTHLAGILNIILLVLLATAVVSIILALIFDYGITATTLAVGCLLLLLSRWLMWQGHLNLAGSITIIALITAMAYLAYVGQGIFDRSLIVFPIIVIIASLILTRRSFVLTTLLCMATIGLLSWAELTGKIITIFHDRVTPFESATIIFMLGVTAVFMTIITNNLQRSLDLAREKEQALANSNLELAQQKQAIEKKELETRAFQQKLQSLHQVGLQLSRAESLNDLYRQAVELGLSELGFERLGLLLYDADTGDMVGTYGTDANGRVVDESYYRGNPGRSEYVEMLTSKSRIILMEEEPLYVAGQEVGHGWNALSALWDGDKGIGWLATDNLLSQQPSAPFELELLALHATTLGHLITRLRQSEAVHQSERDGREFQEKLQTLHEISLILGQIPTLDELYHQAVALGLSRLGFERLGLLLFNPETKEMQGTFGTNEQGELIDERDFHQILNPKSSLYVLLNEQKRINYTANANLYRSGKIMGKGWRATSALWDGEQGIGWLSIDNLISGMPSKPDQLEILSLYGATLGHLITRKRAELALEASEAEARLFQEKLQALHEVSITLANTAALTDLYRQAIVLGRERLGFDRLGLLLFDEETNLMTGTFGTDEYGRLRDEKFIKQPVDNPELMNILANKQRLGFWPDVPLINMHQTIGHGWNALSVLWNGDKGIGWLATDNLIRQEPPTPMLLDILVLYSTFLGHLVTLKKNEAAIQAYTVELVHSNEELQQFAYIASHDLQEPLRKIHAFGDRLQARYGDVLDERGKDYLDRMANATLRMETLIKDLLAFSRLGTQTRPFTAVNLNQVIHEVLSDMETHIEERQAQIQLDNLPQIEADATQMRQLFQNLLSNALKFQQPETTPIIEVRCQNDGDMYQIQIKDNGVGFDEKFSERIFGVFQRLHGRSEYEGTGIGLALCRRIVERHNGRIGVHSTVGTGSTFTITLPIQQPKQT